MKHFLNAFIFALCTTAIGLTAPDALAMKKKGMGGMGGKKGMGQRTTADSLPYDHYEAKGLFATGLRPVFPAGLDCPEVSSPYGSQTRYDGSQRNNAHHNYHNGMDISVDPGTPLLSIADGKVIHVGSAGQLVGNFIWLHYTPQATGLPFHVFARYQHLDSPSPLNVGDRVRAGDPVGPGGNTGTTGGHFGRAGYSHLHLVLYTGPDATYTVNGPMLGPKTLNYLDPLALYLDDKPTNISNHALRDLPDGQKNVAVPVTLSDGTRVPSGATMTWPVACTQ